MLIDGIGAMISTILLGVVLVELEQYIGMPSEVLYPLAGVALVFAAYSLGCYLFVQIISSTHIRIIACANLAYCTLTAYLVVDLLDQLTTLGVVYFIGEMVVIIGLAILELKTATEVANK